MPKRFLALAALLAFIPSAQAQDGADDPLPKGAKTRYGTSRPILRTGPGVALIAPKYTDFLAPTLKGNVRRYDLATGRPFDQKDFVGPGQVVVSADGKRAAIARLGIVTVVEVASRKQLLASQQVDGVLIVGTPGIALSGDGKVVAYGARGQDGKGLVVVSDVDKNDVLTVVETNRAAPVHMSLSRDGKVLVTHGPPAPAPTIAGQPPKKGPMPMPMPAVAAEEARTAQVWEAASGKPLFTASLTGMGGMVVASAISPDGELVAISAGDGPIELWEVETGKRVKTLLGRKGQGVRLALSPDGKSVASVGPDYRIQCWKVDGKAVGISDPPPGLLIAPITGLEFADNERAIAWVTAAQFACAWEYPTGKILSPVMDHANSVRSIAFPKGGKDLLSAGLDGKVFRWDRGTGQLSEEITLHPAHLPGQPRLRPVVALSADGTIATRQTNPTEVFDVLTGKDLFCIPPPASPPTIVTSTISQDGTRIAKMTRQAAGKRTGRCAVWDLTTQERIAEFELPGTLSAGGPAGSFSPDNSRLITITIATSAEAGGRQVFLITGFDVKTGKKLAEVENPIGAGTVTISVAPIDETWAIVASSAGRVWAVDYAHGQIGEEIDKLPVRGEAPFHGPIAMNKDGTRFATGIVGEQYKTYGVRVYSWPDPKVLHTFIGHRGPVTGLRFSPDGNALASGSSDTSVILWDLKE